MSGAFDKLIEIRPALAKGIDSQPREDEFLSARELNPVGRQLATTRLRGVLAELEELFRDKRWQQILDLFFPVEDNLPELAAHGLDSGVREKVAFALGQLGRYDDALEQLELCVAREPGRFHLHSSLAYTAYNSLFAARNREILLSGKVREARIALAHRHFVEAQRLRPDGVTNFYRQGMLLHKIEDKPRKALPVFSQAVANWEALDPDARQRRHQEHKNYVKALFQQAGILLAEGDPKRAEAALKRCLAEDEKSDHLSRLHKYFALGKIEYHANRLQEARSALLFAEKCRNRQPIDFVLELLARVYLGLENPSKALESLQRLPEGHRRAYFRWTEADTLCALGRYDDAKSVLSACNGRDRRSRHKGLIRLCKIHYLLGEYGDVVACAREADRFFRDKWTNACAEALFWQALGALRAGELREARRAADELCTFQPGFPKLDRLLEELAKGGESHDTRT